MWIMYELGYTYRCVISMSNGSEPQWVRGTFHAFSDLGGVMWTLKNRLETSREYQEFSVCVCKCVCTLMSSPCTVCWLQHTESARQWQLVEVNESFFVLNNTMDPIYSLLALACKWTLLTAPTRSRPQKSTNKNNRLYIYRTFPAHRTTLALIH